jgi:predicted 3-demethylubiquinone-9 3-methyltransferase (glyoxalase superfamily)
VLTGAEGHIALCAAARRAVAARFTRRYRADHVAWTSHERTRIPAGGNMATFHKIVPCLWFDDQAEEAARYYVSVFEKSSRITRVSLYGEAGKEIHGRKPGSVMTVEFELEGVPFTGLNGGPQFEFNEAISLQIQCETQDEIDRFWNKLGKDGDEKAQQCGWLKDRFGISWQVVPTSLANMVADRDRAKADRVMAALLKMKKLEIATLRAAYAG